MERTLLAQKHKAPFMREMSSQHLLARLVFASKLGSRSQPASRMLAYAEMEHTRFCTSRVIASTSLPSPYVLPKNGGRGAR